MNTTDANVPSSLNLAQIAWVVKDIETTKRFFQDVLGISNFSKVETIRVKEFEATYYGEPSDAESLVASAYSGGTFIELIQPVAYSLPVADLDKIISGFENKGFPIISSFNTPIAKIVFFDTRKEIGVFTEIIGITEEGEKAVQKMKRQAI